MVLLTVELCNIIKTKNLESFKNYTNPFDLTKVNIYIFENLIEYVIKTNSSDILWYIFGQIKNDDEKVLLIWDKV